MKVIVKPHKIKIELEHDYNSGEYNVQECNFEFSDEYTGLSKVVIFSNSNVTKEIQIYDDKCIVPAEVLQNEGVVGIGVYGYEVSGDELTLRYSPKPQCFSVEKGSYAEGTQPVPPTPSVVEQLQQQITNNANNISSLQDLTALHGEQIETNANDISAIKSEQTTQNNKIQANTEEIESINGIIPTLAKKTEIPTKVSQLENDSNYVTETEMSNAIDEEKTERENADIELQSQIDAITVSPDVVDVVGTYQELLDYDTSKLTDDDIIKVLVDSTHNDALSYYRWQITGGIGSWQYIGSEGPFYTKSETNSLLNEKQDEITNDNKLDSDLVRDDGQTNKFVTVQEKTTWNNKQDALTFDNAPTENSNNPVKSGGIYDFVNTKLEDYVLETDFVESQSLQDDEIARNKMIYNAMPKVSGEGTDLTLNNTAECPVYDIESSPSELEQETTSGKNLANINAINNISTSNVKLTITNDTVIISDNVNAAGYINTNTKLNELCPNLQVGDVVYLFFDTTSSVTNKNLIFIGETWTKGTSKTITQTMLDSNVALYGGYQETAVISNFMITKENDSTYEPFTYGASPNPQYPQEIHTVSGENTISIFGKNWANSELLYQQMYNHNPDYVSKEIVDGVECINFRNSSYRSNFKGLYGTPFKKNTKYIFSCDVRVSDTTITDGSALYINITYDDETTTSSGRINANGSNWRHISLVTDDDKTISYISFSYGAVAYWLIKNIMISEYVVGETPNYVPYISQTYPLSLGDLEYCKIGDYEDLFFKNVVGSEYYDSTLELDKWYLKKRIGKIDLGTLTWISENEYSLGQFRNNSNLWSNIPLINGGLKCPIFIYQEGTVAYNTLEEGKMAITNSQTSPMLRVKSSKYSTYSANEFKTAMNGKYLYYQMYTSTYTLLSDTLQTQLDNIQKAITYQDQTNVSQTNNDLPFVINLSAIRDLSGIFELIQ